MFQSQRQESNRHDIELELGYHFSTRDCYMMPNVIENTTQLINYNQNFIKWLLHTKLG